MSGTVDLKQLADAAYSRLRSTEHPAERERNVGVPGRSTPPEQAERFPQAPAVGCRHVTDPNLVAFYTTHPELTCARCWLALHPERRRRRQPGAFFASIADLTKYAEKLRRRRSGDGE